MNDFDQKKQALTEAFEDFCQDKPELSSTKQKVGFLEFMKDNRNFSTFETGADAYFKNLSKDNLDSKIDDLWEKKTELHANDVEPTKRIVDKSNLESTTEEVFFQGEEPVNVEETASELTEELVDGIPHAFRTESLKDQNARINSQIDENRQKAGIIK